MSVQQAAKPIDPFESDTTLRSRSSVGAIDSPATEAAEGNASIATTSTVASITFPVPLPEKDSIVEVVRFAACLIVVFCHFCSAFVPHSIFAVHSVGLNSPGVVSAGYPGGLSLLNNPFFNTLTAGNFAVAIFFVLSGYVLAKPTFQKTRFEWSPLAGDILKRYLRLALPLMFFSLVAYVGLKSQLYMKTGFAAGQITGSAWLVGIISTMARLDKNLLLCAISPFENAPLFVSPAWTIGTELLGSYVSYALAGIIAASTGGLAILAFAFLCVPGYLKLFVVGTLYAFVECRGKLNYANMRAAAGKYLPMIFAVSVALCIYVDSYPWYVVPADMGQYASIYLPLMKVNSWLVRAGIAGGVTSLGAIVTFFFVKLLLPESKTMQSLALFGKHTYTVYLAHSIIISTIASSVLLQTIKPGFQHYESTLAFAMSAVVISILVVCLTLTSLIDGNSIELARRLKKWYLAGCAR